MSRIINIHKEEGETPLEAIQRFEAEHPEEAGKGWSYLGRLDPLASGVLLLAERPGERERAWYDTLDKTYEVTVLFGVATDTYDLLGHITECSGRDTLALLPAANVFAEVSALVGTREQPYPPYSSKPVDGKPLFQWAREGTLDDIQIPTKEITIHEALCSKIGAIQGDALLASVRERIARVSGDFRQEQTLAVWERELGSLYDVTFPTVSLTLRVSSGTYVRAIAHEFGGAFSLPSLALTIKRTEVGSYTVRE
ncbi:hypothetical protein GVX82_02310 [Patescibacteria group bacterium]|jgi:tRNA pseudouridine55 synthase|nr:hypothetical protein [Patescibacteria group bacterium]